MSLSPKQLVAVADDDPSILEFMTVRLGDWGLRTAAAADPHQLNRVLEHERPCLLVLDLYFGEVNGAQLMTEVRKKYPDLPVVILTGNGTIEAAVDAVKAGAFDFLTKPPDHLRLEMIVRHCLERQELGQRLRDLEQKAGRHATRRLWGESPAMRRVQSLIEAVAPTDAPVLILGESGTGKELAARELHARGGSPQGPFVAVNMAALPPTLVESTLFGHERGAFTGADRVRVGCCELADGGTLFLDEIGEMDLALQAKLLRFLQERTIERVGSSKCIPIGCRVIAATNRALLQAVASGTFREDLYYRLNVVPLSLPPLRDRRGDIGPLAYRFLECNCVRYRKVLSGFAPEVLEQMTAYDWPGNVRQLENVVERMVILAHPSSTDLWLDDLPPEVHSTPSDPTPADESCAGLTRMELLERQAILDALGKSDGKVGAAARILGLGQATVYRKLKRFGIDARSAAVTAS